MMNKKVFKEHLVNVLGEKGIDAKRFSIFEPYYPLWVDVYVKEKNIVELHTSLRFRKPSELLRRETGNAPFKLVEQ